MERIAFVFGRPRLNSAKLQYMPFALSALKKLAESHPAGIDVYLTQELSNDYNAMGLANVEFTFMDNTFVWSKGSGSKLHYLLNVYFWWLSRGKRYSEVWGVGQAGVVLGGRLARRNKARFICLNDEFPDTSYLAVWRENEKKYAATASVVVLPDESRIEVLKKQVRFNKKTKFIVLPNIPLQRDVKTQTFSWKQKLGLKETDKLVMYAGGIDRENNIELLLSVFPFTPDNFRLVMVGNGRNYKSDRYLSHERIIWIETPMTDDELHALKAESVCSVCYYADFMDLEFVGKSSGKIMRSLLAGTPVITTRFDSLKFIEEDGMGELITKPYEMIAAISRIDGNLHTYKANIQKHITKYTFERYWETAKPVILN